MLVTWVGRATFIAGGNVGIVQIAGEIEHLGHNLTGRQVARQSILGRRTKRAAHRAADLTGNAEGASLIVEHEHRLNRLPIGQTEENLLRILI